MRISIVGSGAVGQAVGRGLMALGNEVAFFDIDAGRARGLRGPIRGRSAVASTRGHLGGEGL